MKFTSFVLNDRLKREVRRRRNNVYVFIVFLAFIGYGTYVTGGRTIDTFYIVTMCVVFLGLGYHQYNQLVSPATILNKTAVEVDITDGLVTLITASYNVPYLINKPSREVKLNLATVTIKIASYPLKGIYDLDFRSYLFFNEDEGIYLITDYFEKELNDILLNR